MKHIIKKIKYTDAPKDVEATLNNPTIIKDFLPPPEQLIKKELNQNF